VGSFNVKGSAGDNRCRGCKGRGAGRGFGKKKKTNGQPCPGKDGGKATFRGITIDKEKEGKKRPTQDEVRATLWAPVGVYWDTKTKR